VKSFGKKLVRWSFFWIILPLMLFYAAIAVFHPEDRLLAHLQSELKQQAGIVLSYENATISPWGSIVLENLSVSQLPGDNVTINNQTVTLTARRYVTADQLVIRLAWKPFLDGKAGLVFNGHAYGGSFEGILMARIQKETAPFEIRGAWRDVDLSRVACDYPSLLINRGICRGSADLLMDQTRTFQYKGPLELFIDNARYRPETHYEGDLDIPEIHRIRAEIEMNYKEIRIHDVWGFGPDTSIQVTGMIYQRLPVRNTWLELDIKLYMTGEDTLKKDEYFPLKIVGPARDPDVTFLGRSLRR